LGNHEFVFLFNSWGLNCLQAKITRYDRETGRLASFSETQEKFGVSYGRQKAEGTKQTLSYV